LALVSLANISPLRAFPVSGSRKREVNSQGTKHTVFASGGLSGRAPPCLTERCKSRLAGSREAGHSESSCQTNKKIGTSAGGSLRAENLCLALTPTRNLLSKQDENQPRGYRQHPATHRPALGTGS